MKTKITILFSLLFLLIVTVFSQAPNSFKYQSMLRKTDGSALTNQNISLRISILKGSLTGTSVYVETQSGTTNSFGIINLNIGEGKIQSGSFINIDWSSSSYFAKVEIDETGGTNYTLSGTSQLLSVPYALYSGKSGNGFNASDTAKWNAKSNFSGNYSDLKNKPFIPDTLKKLKLDAGNNIINNVASPINKGDAVNKSYVDINVAYSVSKTGDTLHLGKNKFVIIPNLSANNNGIGIITQVPNITWSKITVDTIANIAHVDFGINAFIAVTDNGCSSTNNCAYVSKDFGVNWIKKSTPGSTDMSGVAFSPINNYFAISHRCYESNRNYSYSADTGNTWTAQQFGLQAYRYSLFRVKDYFFSSIYNSSGDRSNDGVNWTHLTYNGTNTTVTTYSDTFRLYYAGGSVGSGSGGTNFWTSPDGINWTQRDTLGKYQFVAGNNVVLAFTTFPSSSSLKQSIDGLNFQFLSLFQMFQLLII